MTKAAEAPAIHWKCAKCGETYTSPIPILGIVHECRPDPVKQPVPRAMIPVEEGGAPE